MRIATPCRPMAALCTLAFSSALHAQDVSCQLSTTSLAFGSYHPLGGQPLDAQASAELRCSQSGGVGARSVRAELSASSGQSGQVMQRAMRSANASLAYNLYTTATRQTVLGDGLGSGTTLVTQLSVPASGQALTTWTIHGRIAGEQRSARVGSYADAVTLTVRFDLLN